MWRLSLCMVRRNSPSKPFCTSSEYKDCVYSTLYICIQYTCIRFIYTCTLRHLFIASDHNYYDCVPLDSFYVVQLCRYVVEWSIVLHVRLYIYIHVVSIIIVDGISVV